jgi:hypothetical protein
MIGRNGARCVPETYDNYTADAQPTWRGVVRVVPAVLRRMEGPIPVLAPTPARAALGTTVGLDN